MDQMGLGVAVRQARLDRGWTQQALADAAGIPQSHVAKIERGADVRASTMLRVATALGLDVQLRRRTRDLFEHPGAESRLAAARAFGVDMGQLFAAYTMGPSERLDYAVESANGLAELLR